MRFISVRTELARRIAITTRIRRLHRRRLQYQVYAGSLLRLVGWPEPVTQAREIVEFETRIAEASWTKAERRDRDKVYNPMSVMRSSRLLAPGFPWQSFLEIGTQGLGNVTQVVVAEKTAFPKLAAIYAATPVEVLKAWAAFNVADHAAPYLSRLSTAAFFEMREKPLSGMQAAARSAGSGRCMRSLAATIGAGDLLRSLWQSWVGRRPALHGKVFSAGVEGEGTGTGRRPQSCVPCPYRAVGLDGTGHQGGGAEEAGDLQRRRSAIPIHRAIIPPW